MLPTFFIIGAQKCATTSLYQLLRRHPQVFLPGCKEPDYFASPRAFQRGRGWYESLFDSAEGAVAVGEASTSYTMFPHYDKVPERLLATVPDARFVYVMRDPVDRMRSAYHHALSTGYEARDMPSALLRDSGYLFPSCYALQLEQWLAAGVPRERIHPVFVEEFRADPTFCWARLTEFLGVDPGWQPTDLDVATHQSAGKRAPRWWWRRFGDLAIRRDFADRLPRRLVELTAEQSPVVSRRIDPAALVVTPQLRERLVGVLRPDLERLDRLVPGVPSSWRSV